ncbi:MAG: lamin tail domain-containing protein [Candidatus Paceibacterota bacterium]
MSHKSTIHKLVLGGALVAGAFLVPFSLVNGYDQNNTHPALTDEAVDFYNASFPGNSLTEDDKYWLIKGSIDEDNWEFPPRQAHHFYDPVYKKGWAGGTSSKEWTLSSDTQVAEASAKILQADISPFRSLSNGDYSYDRALFDFAAGDRKRAMYAMGHIMHLLEDANAPEHSRDDTHISIGHTTGSPYEKEMAKWNAGNFNIAQDLKSKGEKPALLNSIGEYFDEIAGYSNGYFFSQDTIDNSKYSRPGIEKTKNLTINGRNKLFIVGKDKNGEEFKLALLNAEVNRNIIEIKSSTLIHPEIGTLILDDYWSRLSKHFVIHGAGALKLFMDQAEAVRREYENNPTLLYQSKPSIFNKFFSFLGVPTKKPGPEPIYSPEIVQTIIEVADIRNSVTPPNNDVIDARTLPLAGTKEVTPSPTPLTRLVPSITPFSTPRPTTSPTPVIAPVSKFIEVMKIQDGDTVQLVDGKFLRLISIDAPEKEDFYYQEASDRLAELVLNKVVRLEKDVSETDNFGRLLRHIYMNDAFVGLEMLRGGYARVLTIPPDTKYSSEFKAAEAEAKANKLGIWSQEDEKETKEKVEGVSAATTGKVVINEIAWAGTTAQALDEWIELYNTEKYDINLDGWTLKSGDNSPNMTLEGVVSAGKYYLIERTDDDTITTQEADIATSFGAGGLNNDGEMLILSDAKGKIMDITGRLGDKWFAGEVSQRISMERISAAGRGDDPANWRNFSGINLIDKDAKGNNINGTPKGPNSQVINNFVSNGGGGGSSVSGSSSSGSGSEPEEEPAEPQVTYPGIVVVNEIAWMGTASSSNDEWIELYNTSSQSVDISGWTLKAQNGMPNISLASKSVDAFGFFLMERTVDTTISDISADQIYVGALEDIGEILELRDKDGNLIDSVGPQDASSSLDWYAGDKDNRVSMERIDPGQDGTDPLNWASNDLVTRNGIDAGGNQINGTPKAQNSVYSPFIAPARPSVITDLSIDDGAFFGKLTLVWTEPSDPDSELGDLGYDIRYATKSFDTEDDWNSAIQMADLHVPAFQTPGDEQSTHQFRILDYNETYYFAIKTQDETGYSDISNQAQYTIPPAFSAVTAFSGLVNPSISWEYDLPNDFGMSQPSLGQNGTIYFGADDNFDTHLYALNVNGTPKWQGMFAVPNHEAPSVPIIADNDMVYFSAGSQVYAIDDDIISGILRWDFAGSGKIGNILMNGDGDIVFSSKDSSNLPTNDHLIKLKPDGTVLWDVFFPSVAGYTPIYGPDGDIYISATHDFYRLDSDNGSVVWKSSSGVSSATHNLTYDSIDNKLYSAINVGFKLFTINPADGGITGDDLEPFNANPTTKVIVSDDLLLVGASLISSNPASDSAVYGIDKATKSILWTFPIASASADPSDTVVNKDIVVDDDGNFYFSTQGGRVYSIDRNGQERWVIDLGAKTSMYPVLGDGVIYIGVNGGKLYKISD